MSPKILKWLLKVKLKIKRHLIGALMTNLGNCNVASFYTYRDSANSLRSIREAQKSLGIKSKILEHKDIIQIALIYDILSDEDIFTILELFNS
jgi:hypothetical protein